MRWGGWHEEEKAEEAVLRVVVVAVALSLTGCVPAGRYYRAIERSYALGRAVGLAAADRDCGHERDTLNAAIEALKAEAAKKDDVIRRFNAIYKNSANKAAGVDLEGK